MDIVCRVEHHPKLALCLQPQSASPCRIQRFLIHELSLWKHLSFILKLIDSLILSGQNRAGSITELTSRHFSFDGH